MPQKIKQNPEFKNYQVICVHENKVDCQDVLDIHGNTIEVRDKMLILSDATQYINSNGGITYVYNLDLPSLIEAKNLKMLRRNVAITRIFEYDKEKPIAWGTVGAFAVAIIAILF